MLDLEYGSPVLNESVYESVVVVIKPKISADMKEIGE
jgi:hypothetical protein